MRAMSLGLIKGMIDEVEQTVSSGHYYYFYYYYCYYYYYYYSSAHIPTACCSSPILFPSSSSLLPLSSSGECDMGPASCPQHGPDPPALLTSPIMG